jgi:hypothetical protein
MSLYAYNNILFISRQPEMFSRLVFDLAYLLNSPRVTTGILNPGNMMLCLTQNARRSLKPGRPGQRENWISFVIVM